MIMIIAKHILILVVLLFPFIATLAAWEQVSLGDKLDFDTNCEYRAELESKASPLRTRFNSTLSKKIGYTPTSVHGGVMSNNKTILQIEAPNGVIVKKFTIVKLEKRCVVLTTNANNKQKSDAVIDTVQVSNKFNFSKTHPGANFGLDYAAYNE